MTTSSSASSQKANTKKQELSLQTTEQQQQLFGLKNTLNNNNFEYLIIHKTIIELRGQVKNVKDYVNALEKRVDGLTGGINYSYYTFNGQGMDIFLNYLKDVANLNSKSMFLDVGSGRGHTVFCVANFLKPVMSYGIEGDRDRYKVGKRNYFV
jgi:hypothetical protein